jgi:hypothetical protein
MSKLSTLIPAASTTSEDNVTAGYLDEMVERLRNMIGTEDLDLDDYRNAYKDAFEENTTLDETGILTAIASVNDDDMDAVVLLMKEMGEKEEATGDEPEVTEAIDETRARAVTLVEKLANDTAFNAHIMMVVQSKETLLTGPVSTLVHLDRVWSDEDWGNVPRPGSTKYDDKEGHRDTDVSDNEPWDLTIAREGKRKRVISWFDETMSAVNPALFSELEDIKEAMKKPDDRTLNNARRKEVATFSVLKKKALLKKIKGRVSTFRDIFQKAVRIKQTMSAIADVTFKDAKSNTHPVVGVTFDWDDREKGTLNPTNVPILIYDNTIASLTDKTCDPVTVTGFLKFKLNEWKSNAEKEGKTPDYAGLLATVERDKESQAAEKLAAKFKVANAGEAVHAFLGLANWLDEAKNLAAYKKHLTSLSNKTEEGVDDKMMTAREQEIWHMGNAFIDMQPLYSFIKADFDRLQDANRDGLKLSPSDVIEAMEAEDRAKRKVA